MESSEDNQPDSRFGKSKEPGCLTGLMGGEDTTGPNHYGRIPLRRLGQSTRGSRLPGRSVMATLILSVAIAVLLVLTLVPLRAEVSTSQLLQQYSVLVLATSPASDFGVQTINQPFWPSMTSLCDSETLSLSGNQTLWLSWRTVTGPDPSYARLQSQNYPAITTLYNVSGVSSGGFALTAVNELNYVCGTELVFSAYSTVAVSISIQAGFVYDKVTHVPLL